MGSLSVWHWLIFLAIVLIFFGGSGKISAIMGDFAKGIKSFKKGMTEDEEAAAKPDPNAPQAPKVIDAKPMASVQPGTQSTQSTKVG